ncbi:glucose-6-phosphate dehydrogenase assembly protein OpcA [Planktothrix sp. FACHB-1355]|uniref:Glucose-6-phosphate dehydrogenase assembly protein OpcA n=1 Tax=Aerosakkonema funiforme FACHB-1375 TaxID=2949571 RepID=A0A926VIJ5_9CYAN|nr:MULTISPECIES: glucose-6-phosphate dehydrogenase assembly protein OpcA [Oscillatoriales]MBD2184427.1 glucose-6-phosphate dehydrogenase assembly protein OpcA [Aerosakkonema funiforme FACHB-1375]MBD3562479.1 glucose-6-phosphate dehydrogenase assembly protein OpcA [Planktothrix sp. FACHB-1355]
MATTSAPIVSLQAPKDVSIAEIETELSQIWQSYSAGGDGAFPAATRAATFSLVVYEPEESQQLLATLGFYTGPVDGIDGPRTVAALEAAQKAFGLSVSGKSNPETLAKLREEAAKKRGQTITADGNGGTLPQYALDASGAGVADAIAATNPCRIIALCPTAGEDEGVIAQVSAYCPIQKQTRTSLICCEYITLRGAEVAIERVGGMIPALLISELPKFLWWKATPDAENSLFKRLAETCNSVIIDSSLCHDPEADLLKVQNLLESGLPIADLNWRRLAAWQELTAEAFDPPERRAYVKEVDRVTIDYEKGNTTQALMYLGWLASRLQWHPVSYEQEGGDYDIKRIRFTGPDDRDVQVELAAIPTADVGDIVGDLIALRLTSTNINADCCTVLCSETGGCMRMEAGGGAQSCRIQQVTSLFDQKAENLLGQQLQRWGRDRLYEESMAVTAAIIKLANRE